MIILKCELISHQLLNIGGCNVIWSVSFFIILVYMHFSIRSFRNAHTLYARKVTPKANPLIESVDASRTSVNSLTSREAMLRDRFIAESFQRKFVNLNKQWKEPVCLFLIYFTLDTTIG